MNYRLRKKQKEILRLLSSSSGERYYHEFIPKVKIALYPELWKECSAEELLIKEYGNDEPEKKSAIAAINRSVKKLVKSELIEMGYGNNSKELNISLTFLGKIKAI